MTQNATVPTTPNIVVKVTPEMIVDSCLSKMPSFPAKEEFSLLVMILSTYIGSDLTPVTVKIDKDQALKMLIALKKIKSVDDINAAHMSVMKGLASVLSDVYTSFEASTGGKFSRSDFSVFEKEYNRETQEQDALRKTASNSLNRVRVVCGQLGLANPDPTLKKTSKVDAPTPVQKKEGVLRVFAKSLVGVLISEDSVTEETIADDLAPQSKPGWKTPPVLNARFFELDTFLATIEDYIKRLEESKLKDSKINVATETLSFMRSQGFDDKLILAMLSEYTILASDQISRSDQIDAEILPEYNSVKEVVQAVADVRSIADLVKAHFIV